MTDGMDLALRNSAETGEPVSPRPGPWWTSDRWRLLLVAAGAFAVWAVLWAYGRIDDVTVTEPWWRHAVYRDATVAAVLVAVALVVVGRWRPRLAADLTVAVAAGATSGLLTLGAHGTRWGATALFGDSALRFEMATRYADHLGLVDYAYRGLPAYYPPAVGWIEGRVADLTGLAGWEAVKPVQLVSMALIPLLSYALWRRVVGDVHAAVVVAASCVLGLRPDKPDEWLVLCCIVPWWLDLVRDVRVPGVRRWPAWWHGVVAGLLLLTHTYFFVPLAVASALGLAVDLLARKPMGPLVRRWLVVIAVALVVSAPYWWGMVAEKLRGAPSDQLQMRYWFSGGYLPHLPVPIDVAGALGAVGLLWLAVSLWRWVRGTAQPVAGGLALALGGASLTLLAGDVATAHGIGTLGFKAVDLITALYAMTGVLGLVEALAWLSRRLRSVRGSQVALLALRAGVAAVVAALLVQGVVGHWVVGARALISQTTRYPDGSWPAGRHGLKPLGYPENVHKGDPSVSAVLGAWRRAAGGRSISEQVLVTSRTDLLATTTVYPFLAWKSIYSHPNGQFAERLRLLHRVAACDGPRCAAALLTHNPFDRVDGLVLSRKGPWFVLVLKLDNFPHAVRKTQVRFPAKVFDGPEFRRVDLRHVSVIALR